MYAWSKLKNNFFPPLADIKKALKQADDLDPAQCDTRPLMAMLVRMVSVDPDISSAMETRKRAVQGYDYHFVSDVDDTAMKQRALGMTDRFKRTKASKLIGLCFASEFFGVAGARYAFAPASVSSFHSIATLDAMDVDDLIRDDAAPLGYVHYAYTDAQQTKAIVTQLTPEDSLIIEYNPFEGFRSRYTGGILRGILAISYLKYLVTHYFSKFTEKFGGPLVIVQYEDGTMKEDVDKILSDLKTLGDFGVGAVPKGAEIALKEAMKSGSVDLYNRFIELAYQQQRTVILGESLTAKTTSAGTKDQRGSTQVANELRMDTVWHDVEFIQNTVNNLYVPLDYRLNYGEPPNGIFPRFEFVTDDAVDYKSNAQIVETLTSAGYDFLDDNEVSEKIGFKVQRAGATT